MSSVQKYRQQMLEKMKRRQISQMRAGMRNLMLYYHQNEGCCLCRNQSWVYEESIQHLVPLIIGIFQQNAVCSAHIDRILNKAYQCLVLYPRNYRKMVQIKEDYKSCKWQIARKLVLLKQIFEEQVLTCNQMLKEEIVECFRQSDKFHISLLDCAYGYSNWFFDEQSEEDEFWDIEIRSYSLSVVLSIIRKAPEMIVSHFGDYPLLELLSQFQGLKRLSFYEMMINLTRQSQNESILAEIARTLGNHLNDIKGMNLNIEERVRIYDWIVVSIRQNLQESTIKCIIVFLGARGGNQLESINRIAKIFEEKGISIPSTSQLPKEEDSCMMQIQY